MSSYLFFFCKQKTAYEMRISDWSSDVCSSDLGGAHPEPAADIVADIGQADLPREPGDLLHIMRVETPPDRQHVRPFPSSAEQPIRRQIPQPGGRSEDHTSKLQTPMRSSSAIFCLQKNTSTSTTVRTRLSRTRPIDSETDMISHMSA